MTAFRILCAVDLTPLGVPAVTLAGVLARATGAEVTLLHACDRRDPEPRLSECLSRLAGKLQSFGIAVRQELAEGEPAPVILQRAAGAAFVVMGTHGGRGVERLMLGSVAEKVLDHAPCPVATVRAGFSGALRRIVCGADLADAAPLVSAMALARQTGAELVVLHSVAELPEEGAHSLVPASYRPVLLAEAHERLSAALATIDCSGVAIREVVAAGPAHRQLVHVAVQEGADLLVVGVHPHLFGSTAHHVVRAADCPVLTVRAVPEESP